MTLVCKDKAKGFRRAVSEHKSIVEVQHGIGGHLLNRTEEEIDRSPAYGK